MAKLGFTKLGLKLNNDIQTIVFNEQTIEIKQYLPTDKKLEIITNVLQLSHDENNFANPIKTHVYLSLEIVEKYTNINFTEKQREDVLKLYDLINSSGLLSTIISSIPEDEYSELKTGVYNTIESVYAYQNSALGILEAAGQDYNTLNFDASEIQQKLADPENMALLKGVLSKLG